MSAIVAHVTPKEDPETLALRARPRRAIRFRRGVVIGGTAGIAIAISALAWISLAPPSFHFAAGADDVQLGSIRPPDALAGAPSSYRNVPQLGPPLPGDLGRPILEQQRAGTDPIAAPPGPDAAALERQRFVDAETHARTSPVLVPMAGGRGEGIQSQGGASATETPLVRAQSEPTAITPEPSFGGHIISAGSTIAASLITGLNSDLPGLVVAQVTEQVRDSVTGRFVLIPQGARLIGRYDSSIKYGQNRAFLAWERLILPDGRSIDLKKMPASDARGQSGLTDSVNSHQWQLLKGVLLSSLIGLGQTIGPSGEGEIARAIRQSAQQGTSKAGEQLVSRQLDVQPTITVRPGWPVRVLVSEDITLPAWSG